MGEAAAKKAGEKKRKSNVGDEKEEKRTRRSLKDVERALNHEIETLKKTLAVTENKLHGAEEQRRESEKRNHLLEIQNALYKNKSNIPELFPNIKAEIQRMEANDMHDENLKIDIETLEKEDIAKICGALAKDLKKMHTKEIDMSMEEHEIGVHFRCNIKQAIPETALSGPDGFCYDVEALHKYIEHNKWNTVFQKDAESGAVHMRVLDWRSPNTRQVWDEAVFSLSHAVNNTVQGLRVDISKRRFAEYVRDVQSYVKTPVKNMKQIADMFGKEIVELHA